MPLVALVACVAPARRPTAPSPCSSRRSPRSPCSCSGRRPLAHGDRRRGVRRGLGGRGVGRPAAAGRARARRDRAAVGPRLQALARAVPRVDARRPTPPPTSAPPPRWPRASKISAAAALLVVGQAVAGAAVDTGSVSIVLGTLAGRVDAARQRHGAAPGRRRPACSPGRPCRRPAGWCCRWPRCQRRGPARVGRLRARVRRGHPRRVRRGRGRGGRGRSSAPAACCAATGSPGVRWRSRCSCSPGCRRASSAWWRRSWPCARPSTPGSGRSPWSPSSRSCSASRSTCAGSPCCSGARPVARPGPGAARPTVAETVGAGDAGGAATGWRAPHGPAPVGAADARGATVLVLGTGILVLFSVLPGLLLGLLS